MCKNGKFRFFVGLNLLGFLVVFNLPANSQSSSQPSCEEEPGTWQEIEGTVNPQSQIVDPSSGCIIDGYWAPVGTGKNEEEAIAYQFFKKDGTYRFKLKATTKKARAEFTNCYSKTSDIPPGEDVDQLEKIRGIDAFCQNGVQPGDYVQYSYKIRFPQFPTKAVVTQWHGRPDRTLITDRFGGGCKVCWLPEDQVADLFDTYDNKKGEFCLKSGQSKPTSATCPTNSRPCFAGRKRVNNCKPFSPSFENSADLEVEQGGYPPLSVKFQDNYFYILARTDAAEFTDKAERCNPRLEGSSGEPLPLTNDKSQKICRASPLLKASVLYKERVTDCPSSGCFRKGLINGSEQSFGNPLVVAGKWIEFTYQVNWSTYSASPSPVPGEIIVWAEADNIPGWENKTKIVEWNDQIGRNDRLGTYFKMGLYTPSGNPDDGIEVRTKEFEQNGEIISKRSGKCLDVEGNSTANNANVQQYHCHNGDNQLWRLRANGAYYEIISKRSNKCLDVKGNSTANNANVQQYDCHNGDNQLWKLQAKGTYYKIISKHSNKCLDVKGNSTADKANVQQYDCHNGDNQLWKF